MIQALPSAIWWVGCAEKLSFIPLTRWQRPCLVQVHFLSSRTLHTLRQWQWAVSNNEPCPIRIIWAGLKLLCCLCSDVLREKVFWRDAATMIQTLASGVTRFFLMWDFVHTLRWTKGTETHFYAHKHTQIIECRRVLSWTYTCYACAQIHTQIHTTRTHRSSSAGAFSAGPTPTVTTHWMRWTAGESINHY